MPTPTNWLAEIASTDLVSVATSTTDPNCVDTRRHKYVILSSDATAGGQVKVDVYTYVEASAEFVPTGDIVVLDAAYSNVAKIETRGLRTAYVATGHNGLGAFTLYVGVYNG